MGTSAHTEVHPPATRMVTAGWVTATSDRTEVPSVATSPVSHMEVGDGDTWPQ